MHALLGNQGSYQHLFSESNQVKIPPVVEFIPKYIIPTRKKHEKK